MNNPKRISFIIALALSVALFCGPEIYAASAPTNGDTLPKNLFIELSKKVNPAVVNISTTQIIRGNPNFPGMMPNDPFREFFEEFLNRGYGGKVPEQKVMSLGSGFIIDGSGLIVTNNHVINNASDIQVQLTEKSKKEYKAKIVGQDPRTDIALIKITTDQKLTPVALGDSDKVEVGEWVAAFGNPFGHGHTVTKGIISATGRDLEIEGVNFPFLQTDASINPGNSGGPLVNANGEVIGVNSAIDRRAQGIGFAIPINVVKRLLPELKAKGKVTRGYLGVMMGNIDDKMKEQLGIKTDKGVIVVNVVPNSPADKAGIKPYDIIVEFSGKEVETTRDLSTLVAETPIGQSAKLRVIREGKPLALTVRIAELNENAMEESDIKGRNIPQGVPSPHGLGVGLSDLNPTLARQLELPPDAPKKGVVVTSIKAGSLAEQAGLQIGDIILDVNKHPVKTAKEAQKYFKPSNNVLRVQRGDQPFLVFMEGGE